MKPRLIALNLLLVLAMGVIVWQGRVRLHEARVKRRNNLSVQIVPAAAAPLSPALKPGPVTAATYADVATKDLFAKDRNPTVVVEPPKVEEPKKMPSLPIVYGVLGLPSGTKAIMSEKAGGASRAVHAGDTIGEFKIASLDPQNVTFDWDGKQISRKIEDLIDRSNSAPAAASSSAAPAAQPASRAPIAAAPGKEIDLGTGKTTLRACVTGDSSPAGTVVDGFRKNVVQTPFGPTCNWMAVQQ